MPAPQLPEKALAHMSDQAKSHVPDTLLPKPQVVDVTFGGTFAATDGADYFVYDFSVQNDDGAVFTTITGFDPSKDFVVFENAALQLTSTTVNTVIYREPGTDDKVYFITNNTYVSADMIAETNARQNLIDTGVTYSTPLAILDDVIITPGEFVL